MFNRDPNRPPLSNAAAAEAIDAAVDYIIRPKLEGMEPDPEVNQRLRAAGFTNEQAQLVYDLAAEYVMPAIQNFLIEREQEFEARLLTEKNGGPDKWKSLQAQIRAWGEANLPKPVFQQLAATPEGIATLQKMMMQAEPRMGGQTEGQSDAMTEEELTQLMRDPRYWKQRDPSLIAKVEAGFKRLYPH